MWTFLNASALYSAVAAQDRQKAGRRVGWSAAEDDHDDEDKEGRRNKTPGKFFGSFFFCRKKPGKWKRGRAEPLICRFVGHQFVQPWTNGAKSRAQGLEIIRNGRKRKRPVGAERTARRLIKLHYWTQSLGGGVKKAQ